MLTGSNDSSAILWDKFTGLCLMKFKHESPLTQVKIIEIGKVIFLITATQSGYLRYWKTVNHNVNFNDSSCYKPNFGNHPKDILKDHDKSINTILFDD